MHIQVERAFQPECAYYTENGKQNNCYMDNEKSTTVRTLLVEKKARWTAKSSPLNSLSSGQKLQMLGAVPPQPPPTLTETCALIGDAIPTYPTVKDWRNINGVNYLTPVKGQGLCQSCVAFSICAVVETMSKKTRFGH